MESSQTVLRLASISRKKLEADFDGGLTTSDGGALLLRQVESKIGIVARLVRVLRDRRHPSYIHHSLLDLIKQRVFQIACGYEDANDSNDLRLDPGLKAACDRLPITGGDLASQPTISRMENDISRTDLYRLAVAFVEAFIASYQTPPKEIILDLDDTDDVTHGAQQLCLFNAHIDEYCYMPLHLYEGHSGRLITTILRPGRRISGRAAAAILQRLFERLRQAWPKVRILLRGDSHFSAPEVHELCDEYQVDFILGQAVNPKLRALGQPLMDQALAQAEESDEPVRLFSCFEYQAGSWRRSRRLVYKAEVTQGKANPRFVVTSIRNRSPRFLYQRIYAARGRMEGFIKEHKTFLHSDRTSCHRFVANQFRLFLHSAAYVLLHALRHQGLHGTQWVRANFNTLQLRLLKVGARVRERATRVRFHFPTSYPLKELMQTLVHNLNMA